MNRYTISFILFNLILSNPKEFIIKSDALNFEGSYQLELLELNNAIQEYPNNTELLWRISRAHFEIADQVENIEIHKKHFYSGFKIADKALKINPNSAKVNHWYAVLIGKIGLLEGTEQKIKNSYEVEKYALKAIELDPDYDGTYHVMGRWNYELANLSWIERKVAEWVYETPPQGGYEEASIFFQKAINVKNDEIRHYYWLAKTYLEMDNNSKAKEIFKEILNIKPFDASDINMQTESKEYIEDL